jgi:hypothetical protein
MKKLFFLILILGSPKSYSQKSYAIRIDAPNVRVWESPLYQENFGTIFLKVKEVVRLIDYPIIIQGGQFGRKEFTKIFRDGNNSKPLYILSSEVRVDLYNGLISSAADAIVKQKSGNLITEPCTFNTYRKNDVLSISNPRMPNNFSSIFSFVNKASLSSSDHLSSKVRGLFIIIDFLEYTIQNERELFLVCQPINSPFNQFSPNKPIYINYEKAFEYSEIQMHVIGYNNGLTSILLEYAYQNNANDILSYFSDKYLSYIYGNSEYSSMDEFQKQKLLTHTKYFIDSMYGQHLKVFSKEFIFAFSTDISDYDFKTNSFNINAFLNSLSSELKERRLKGLCSDIKSKKLQTGFLNLNLYEPSLKISPDSAELFLNQIKRNGLEGQYDLRNIILVAYFHFVKEDDARSFFISTNTHPLDYMNNNTEYSPYKYQKVIDSFQVYSNTMFLTKWKVIYAGAVNRIEDLVKVDIPAAFKGGEASFKKYVERNFQRDTQYSIKVDYKFKISEDGKIEILDLKVSDLKYLDEVRRLILEGPRWIPAISKGRSVSSILEGSWFL